MSDGAAGERSSLDFRAFDWNGTSALRTLLETSDYGSVSQAVAALTAFVHPDTVAATGNAAIFPVIRARFGADRGRYIVQEDGRAVMADDNRAPTCAFLWSSGYITGGAKALFADVQINHVWTDSQNPHIYSSLANLCMTPSFLAKLTDTDPHVQALLHRRAFDLFGFVPAGPPVPSVPPGYHALRWCEPMARAADPEAIMRRAMSSKPRDRVTRCAREIGWLFSNFQPDTTL
jgi:hypothetical protein